MRSVVSHIVSKSGQQKGNPSTTRALQNGQPTATESGRWNRWTNLDFCRMIQRARLVDRNALSKLIKKSPVFGLTSSSARRASGVSMFPQSGAIFLR
jgi:hypothetical protein